MRPNRRTVPNQAAHRVERYVSAEARRHLEAWLIAAGLTEGPIFCRFNRHGAPLPKALQPNAVALIFKDLTRRAGYAPHEVAAIAGHSTRIGATHVLGKAGYSNLLIQHDGGWSPPQMVGVYSRERAVKERRHGTVV